MSKFFNGRKYFFSKSENRWSRTAIPQEQLSHDVWNFFHPGDPILKGDGYVIHHKNGDSSDDRIENLQKMKHGTHSRLHNTGKNHPMFGKRWFHTNKTKQKMRDSWTDERKEEESKAKLGHIVTDETKQKMRVLNLGDKNPNWKGGKSIKAGRDVN